MIFYNKIAAKSNLKSQFIVLIFKPNVIIGNKVVVIQNLQFCDKVKILHQKVTILKNFRFCVILEENVAKLQNFEILQQRFLLLGQSCSYRKFQVLQHKDITLRQKV